MSPLHEETLTSWGRLDRSSRPVVRPRFRADAISALSAFGPAQAAVAGLGRSYGDVGLSSHATHLVMTGLDRLMSFDRHAGVVTAEAGISLSELLRIIVPAGFFLPTTPGSRFVTLGGAVANDVHGKNHHRAGSFGAHVRRLGLALSSGEVLTVSQSEHPDLFIATIGGLGLTGVIVWVELALTRIASAYLDVETLPFRDLEAFVELAAESVRSHEHTVSWIDCMGSGAKLGRGVFSRANWRDDGRLVPHKTNGKLSLPIDAPGFALNRYSVAAFNAAYAFLGKSKAGIRQAHYEPFFYPLDAIGSWNRMYGSKGFYQYQCVTPISAGIDPVGDMLKLISASGQGSFLAVLKSFGPKVSSGLLSFPMEGYTLALDFPNKGARALALFEDLDRIVATAGGRLYPAKDARMSKAMFELGYPEKERFLKHRDEALTTDFAERVLY